VTGRKASLFSSVTTLTSNLLFYIRILTPSRFRVKYCFRLVTPSPSETADLRASRWFSSTSPIASLNMHTLRCRQEKELKVWTEENRVLSQPFGAWNSKEEIVLVRLRPINVGWRDVCSLSDCLRPAMAWAFCIAWAGAFGK
jgi:hypothetical protein